MSQRSSRDAAGARHRAAVDRSSIAFGALVAVSGSLDGRVAVSLVAEARAALAASAGSLVIDLDATTSFDALGLHALRRVLELAKRARTSVVLVAQSAVPKKLADLAAQPHACRMVPTRRVALAAAIAASVA